MTLYSLVSRLRNSYSFFRQAYQRIREYPLIEAEIEELRRTLEDSRTENEKLKNLVGLEKKGIAEWRDRFRSLEKLYIREKEERKRILPSFFRRELTESEKKYAVNLIVNHNLSSKDINSIISERGGKGLKEKLEELSGMS
jgi:predicted  nucleic acid-binding Zn-ribbon protein